MTCDWCAATGQTHTKKSVLSVPRTSLSVAFPFEQKMPGKEAGESNDSDFPVPIPHCLPDGARVDRGVHGRPMTSTYPYVQHEETSSPRNTAECVHPAPKRRGERLTAAPLPTDDGPGMKETSEGSKAYRKADTLQGETADNRQGSVVDPSPGQDVPVTSS